ncbi:MAG: hypothetical protein OHK005_03960 [Candidatus Methylacidiphilales bacterium]
MKKIAGLSAGVIALAFVVLFSGCSTPQTRAREKEAAFASLKPAQQQLVLQGKIEEGMSPEAVYIALGRPARVTEARLERRSLTRWIYGRTSTQYLPSYRFRSVVLPNGQIYLAPVYQPDTVTTWVDTFAVIFEKGKVIGWEEL